MINIEKLATFDIETAGGWATLADLENENPKMADLWRKRCVFLRGRFDNNTEMTDDELFELKTGLHAEFAKVVCVSFGIYKNDQIIMQSSCGNDEKEILTWTADMLDKCDRLGMTLAGHTIERFDIPFLWKRFIANEIKPPNIITIWNKKPWDVSFFDVAKFWSNGTWQESFTSLDTMATMFGIDSPKDVMQASRVHDIFWKEKDLAGIEKYCAGDVRATIEVIKKMLDIF